MEPRKAKASARSAGSSSFDARYFRRYYESRRSRVYGSEQIDHLARGIVGLVRWFGGDLERVLDVGAGIGLWRDWFRANLPKVQYRSIDVSEYACRTYGHEQLDITRWRGRQKYDLVICQGVLPYLEDRACSRAVSNVAAMCRGFLYLEAITARDLRDVCDRTRTDVSVHSRPAGYYRRMLARYFEPLGCGLHHVKGGDQLFYDLERG
jgi:2-polyprenyl-3-methyl-5-hydroxy-6-metoxy-1,4-benzoquinol methylase